MTNHNTNLSTQILKLLPFPIKVEVCTETEVNMITSIETEKKKDNCQFFT